jgi:hypothetical protein
VFTEAAGEQNHLGAIWQASASQVCEGKRRKAAEVQNLAEL